MQDVVRQWTCESIKKMYGQCISYEHKDVAPYRTQHWSTENEDKENENRLARILSTGNVWPMSQSVRHEQGSTTPHAGVIAFLRQVPDRTG